MNNITSEKSTTGMPATQAVKLTVCIVSNRLDQKLEEIINVCHPFVAAILIGYDGDMSLISPDFNPENKAEIVPVKWQGFSTTKNYLAAQAESDWILSLDGDEVPDETLLDEIKNLALSTIPQNTIFSLKRISFFEEKKIMHGAWGRDRVIRLYNRNYTQWDNAEVHEQLEIKADTLIIKPKGILYHYTADDYEVFLAKNKNYARLSAIKYFAKKKRSPLWKRLLSPGFTFIKEYVFQGGFLDGNAGLKIASANARYTYWKYSFLRQRYQESPIIP